MHTTYAELKDQTAALGQTITAINGCSVEVKKFIDRHAPRFMLYLACGSCYCLAESLALSTQLHLKLPAMALPAGDFLLHSSSYEPLLEKAMVVAISRSGKTSELIAAVERIRADEGTPVLSITCAAGSPLSKLSDMTVEMPWCHDQSVCQTRAASCLYLAGSLLIARLAGNEKLAEGFGRAAAGIRQFMEQEQELKAVAGKPWTNAVVLADAELAGIGAAAALTFKEISQCPADYYHLMDVRHGPVVIIGKSTLVLAVLTDGNQYELDLLGDIAKTGAELVVYSDIPLDFLPENATNISFGKSLPHAARGLPLLLAAQLLAYHKAVAGSLNPDAPGSLTPWIKL